MLTGVTLTGADDTVEPDELVRLSEQFPFVEWGILIGSHAGGPRWPSHKWLKALLTVAESAVNVNLSLHICGQPLRSLLTGVCDFPDVLTNGFQFGRAQLNFHGERITTGQAAKLLGVLSGDWIADRTIVQLDSVNDWVLTDMLDAGFRAEGLYDVSHGAGVLPKKWPRPNPGWEIGFAGGLSPENVKSEVQRMIEVARSQRFWIDMETKVRTLDDEDGFDLWKCRSVLETCDPIVGKSVMV